MDKDAAAGLFFGVFAVVLFILVKRARQLERELFRDDEKEPPDRTKDT